MLPTLYQGLEFAEVKKPADLFKDQKLGNIKRILDATGNLFKTGKSPVLYICPTEPIYKIVIVTPSRGKTIPIGEIYIIPKERRVDLYDGGNLLAQWKGSKLMFQGFSPLMSSIKLDKQFVQLYNIL